jgi:para-nitrobenzyl esterase
MVMMRSLFALLSLAGAAAEKGATLHETVQTEFGPVIGHTRQGVMTWLGVPFAAPPVGQLRFREPQSPPKWSSPLVANKSFLCLQPFGKSGSEDHCLEANVWAPSNKTKPPSSVLVWIHGGGNYMTSPAEPVFDGTGLVLESLSGAPVIVAAIGYRLAALGFLALPELTAESSHGSSGNYGFLDQVAGLRWIKTNIHHFGAAPNARVTVFGESAGAWDLGAHLASPLSKGLFDGVVMESPYQVFQFYNLTQAERGGTYCAQQCLKNNPSFQDPLECMRSLQASEVQTCLHNPADEAADVLNTVVPVNIDGYALKCIPFDAISARSDECGSLPSVPVMVGSSTHEGHLLAGSFKFDGQTVDDFIWKLYNNIAYQYGKAVPTTKKAEVIATAHKMYPADPKRAASLSASQFFGPNVTMTTDWLQKVDMDGSDVMLGCSAYFTAKALAGRATTSAYLYLFNHAPSQPILKQLMATHTSEMPYVFGTFNAYSEGQYHGPGDNHWNPTDDERNLSKTMMEYWLNFARTGMPSTSSLPEWPAVKLDGSKLTGFLNVTISPHAEMNAEYNHAHQCEFWMSAVHQGDDQSSTPVYV